MSSRPVPSAALLAANERLLQLRAKTQARPQTETVSCSQVTEQGALLNDLPAHLGWGSQPLTVALRTAQPQQNTPSTAQSDSSQISGIQTTPAPEKRPFSATTPIPAAKIYPDIALGMLRQEQAAAGRLWLLLRHLDSEGCGVLRVVNIRETFTTPKAPLHLCGWRQMRNLLRQGEGIFWQRDKESVWLRSAGKVAAGLGVARLNGRPVAVPVKHLLGSIGEARAYLYASFHAGRRPTDDRRERPIARDTLADLTGLTAESQRSYERRAGVDVSRNYVVGERLSAAGCEEQVWRRGGGAFGFVDYRGGQGKPGVTYMAWQLPNSYKVRLDHRPRGRQKRINRMLSDLFMKGMTGNARQTIEKRYFGDGARAAQAIQKQNQALAEAYWRQTSHGNVSWRLWHVVRHANGV
jgi:hypothetical protein